MATGKHVGYYYSEGAPLQAAEFTVLIRDRVKQMQRGKGTMNSRVVLPKDLADVPVTSHVAAKIAVHELQQRVFPIALVRNGGTVVDPNTMDHRLVQDLIASYLDAPVYTLPA